MLNQTFDAMPSVQPQRLATVSGNMALDRPSTVVVPEIPKDAFQNNVPNMWLVIAVLELAIIGWLGYRLYQLQHHGSKRN